MNMLVSGVSSKEGKRIAYVLFEDGERSAEAVIPDCRIVSSKGFSKEELDQLAEYLEANLQTLKKQAAGINPLRAMMQD